MVDNSYMRAEDMVKEEPKPKRIAKPMVIKINHKPIRIQEEEVSEFSWTYLAVSSLGYLMCFYIMDLAAHLFLGIHPFPFVKFVGVILSWFGLV